MDDPRIQPLAKKYKKTPAQILVRWSLQKVRNPTFSVIMSWQFPNTRFLSIGLRSSSQIRN